MEADIFVTIVGSNTQTIMTRMCGFHRGRRTFREEHNTIMIPVRSSKFYSTGGLKHQELVVSVTGREVLKMGNTKGYITIY